MKQRTESQNKALHKYFRMLADHLNEQGLDMRMLREDIDISWSADMVKRYLWEGDYDTFIRKLEPYIDTILPTEEQLSKARKPLGYLFKLVADALNDAGNDMRAVLPSSVKIVWTPERVKDYLWRPIMRLKVGVESTTEMSTKDIDVVKDELDRWLAMKHGVTALEFPSIINLNDYYYG